jgi:hypothetical protein
MSDEQWAALSPRDKVQNILRWGGNVIASMTGMGPAGQTALDHPGETLAVAAGTVAGPVVMGQIPALAHVLEAGGMTGRAATMAQHATPMLKYEVAKFALKQIGLPDSVAGFLAATLSGGRGAKAPAAAEAPHVPTAAGYERYMPNSSGAMSVAAEAEAVPAVAAGVGPAASVPAAPGPPVGPSVPAVGQTTPAARAPFQNWSPQRVRNEVGLAERRNGLTLTEPQRAQADHLVAQGLAPKDAVQAASGQGPATSVPTPTAAAEAPAAAAKVQLNAAETQAYQRLLAKGLTPQQAVEAIEAQRLLAQRLGTPSPERTRQRIVERNTTGRWPKDE